MPIEQIALVLWFSKEINLNSPINCENVQTVKKSLTAVAADPGCLQFPLKLSTVLLPSNLAGPLYITERPALLVDSPHPSSVHCPLSTVLPSGSLQQDLSHCLRAVTDDSHDVTLA